MKPYEVLTDLNPDSLEKKVNDAINEGYEPMGGVTVTPVVYNDELDFIGPGNGKPCYLFAQAVYKPK